MSELLKSESLYSNLIATLDEFAFLKELSKEIKSVVSCDIIKTSIPITKSESKLIYSNKNHSKIGQLFPHSGVAGHVARSKKPYFSNSIERDPVFMGHVSESIVSEMCVPVIAGGSVLGVIQLKRSEGSGAFSKADADLIMKVITSIEKPIANLSIYLAAKSLNETLLRKIEEKERNKIKELSIDKNFIIKEPKIIGKSERLINMLSMAKRGAEQDVNILIKGESGTGKEAIARFIHCNSKNKESAFAVVDCSSRDLAEISSKLFGDEKNQGLVDIVKKGTIVIKKIEEMNLPLQSKLLSFLKSTKPNKVKVITTTSTNMVERIHDGLFREDLYYFLNTLEVEVPGLREREGDIQLLVNHYLNEDKDLSEQKSFSPGAMKKLISYNWPGNILELKSIVERAYILADGMIVERAHLSESVNYEEEIEQEEAEQENYKFIEMQLDELERFHICQMLEHLGGNKTKTAKKLGITVKTLYNKLHTYGMIGNRDSE
jgi:Nif-specific regulatory protein